MLIKPTSDQPLTFRAGAAKIDITPPVGCWLEGIPRAQPSDALHDPLYARALVVEYVGAGGRVEERLCLVTCDLIGLAVPFGLSAQQQVAGTLAIEPAQVVIACSHNHSGPAMLGLDDPRHVDPGYLDFLLARLVEVSQAAAGAAEPARLGTGRGEETTISEYRRLWTRAGRIVMNWEEFSPEDITGPAEAGDPELGVVKIDNLAGQVVAVIFNYACHPNSLPGDNFTMTADFPGYAAALIERELGGLALFTNGAQGSVDIEGFVDRDLYGVERRGKALAGGVLAVCREIETRPDPVLGSARSVFLLPYRQIPPETLAWARGVAARASGEAVTLRDGISDELKADNILRLAGQPGPGVDFEMIGFRLGSSIFVTIPGELFTEIGRQMKALSPAVPLYVIGLANGYHGYLPTAKASAEGGYATDLGTGAYFAENAEELIGQNTGVLLTSLV